MEVRIKFDADIVITGDTMEQVRSKFENMPLWSEEAKACGVEFSEIQLIEDADTYKDLADEYDSCYDDEDGDEVIDANGYIIKKGDKVTWANPETGNKAEYEVYEEPTEEMVKLRNEHGECEAHPWECRIIQ